MTAAVPAAPAARPRLLIVSSYLVAAAGSMLVAGLLGVYLAFRDRTPAADWPPADLSLHNVAGLILTITMLMSAVSAWWIVSAARSDDRRNLLFADLLTMMFGLAHINGLAFVFRDYGVPAAGSPYGTLFFTVLGTHIALVVGGLVGLLAVLVRGAGGQLVPGKEEPAKAFAIYWEFVVVAWLAIYAIVFLVK